ncbi:hypothetical protein ACJX0J_006206, partial [Zea mays]
FFSKWNSLLPVYIRHILGTIKMWRRNKHMGPLLLAYNPFVAVHAASISSFTFTYLLYLLFFKNIWTDYFLKNNLIC